MLTSYWELGPRIWTVNLPKHIHLDPIKIVRFMKKSMGTYCCMNNRDMLKTFQITIKLQDYYLHSKAIQVDLDFLGPAFLHYFRLCPNVLDSVSKL